MIFFILFLPLQYALVGLSDSLKSEPWPALVLPAFKNAFGPQKQISIHQVELFVKDNKTGKQKEIDPAELFPDVPKSQLSGFLQLHFSDSSKIAAFNRQTKEWLKDKLDQLKPAAHYQSLIVREVEKNYQPGKMPQSRLETEKRFTISLNRE